MLGQDIEISKTCQNITFNVSHTFNKSLYNFISYIIKYIYYLRKSSSGIIIANHSSKMPYCCPPFSDYLSLFFFLNAVLWILFDCCLVKSAYLTRPSINVTSLSKASLLTIDHDTFPCYTFFLIIFCHRLW